MSVIDVLSRVDAGLPEIQPRRERVLVVDDDRTAIAIVRAVAEACGFEVRSAGSAAECCAAVDDWRPHLIVLDVVLPDRDGIELVRDLARRRCDATIVPMSGYDAAYLRCVEDLGAAYGLRTCRGQEKPLDLQRLRAALGERGDVLVSVAN